MDRSEHRSLLSCQGYKFENDKFEKSRCNVI